MHTRRLGNVELVIVFNETSRLSKQLAFRLLTLTCCLSCPDDGGPRAKRAPFARAAPTQASVPPAPKARIRPARDLGRVNLGGVKGRLFDIKCACLAPSFALLVYFCCVMLCFISPLLRPHLLCPHHCRSNRGLGRGHPGVPRGWAARAEGTRLWGARGRRVGSGISRIRRSPFYESFRDSSNNTWFKNMFVFVFVRIGGQ